MCTRKALATLRRLAAAGAGATVVVLAAAPLAQAGTFVEQGADYLIDTLQDHDPVTGGFFQNGLDMGGNPSGVYVGSEQGQFGLSVLRAYQTEPTTTPAQQAEKAKYLASAERLGEAIINAEDHSVINAGSAQADLGEIYFNTGVGVGSAPKGQPIVYTQSTLFLENLAQVTPNASLRSEINSYLNTNYFAPLTAGTYGGGDSAHAFAAAGGGVGTAGYVSKIQSDCGAYSPWCFAAPTVASYQAGQGQIANDFFDGIEAGLNAVSSGDTYYDVLGLAAAIWTSALTGKDLSVTGGLWHDQICGTDSNCTASTAQLAGLLAAMIGTGDPNDPNALAAGAFPYNSAYPGIADIETTGDAVLALAAFDMNMYRDQVNAGLAYLSTQQEFERLHRRRSERVGPVQRHPILYPGRGASALHSDRYGRQWPARLDRPAVLSAGPRAGDARTVRRGGRVSRLRPPPPPGSLTAVTTWQCRPPRPRPRAPAS